MFFEEILNCEKVENTPSDWELEGIITRVRNRYFNYEDELSKDFEIKDEYSERLSNCINADMINADWMLKDMFKKLIMNISEILRFKTLDENEFYDLKYFVLENLQGYCPCTHRTLGYIDR